MSSNRIDAYVNETCRHIKWKKSHVLIKEELTAHAEDAVNHYMENGATRQQAEENALEDMGDAAVVGASLNKAYKPQINILLFIVPAAVLILAQSFLRWAADPMNIRVMSHWENTDLANIIILAGFLALGFFASLRLLHSGTRFFASALWAVQAVLTAGHIAYWCVLTAQSTSLPLPLLKTLFMFERVAPRLTAVIPFAATLLLAFEVGKSKKEVLNGYYSALWLVPYVLALPVNATAALASLFCGGAVLVFGAVKNAKEGARAQTRRTIAAIIALAITGVLLCALLSGIPVLQIIVLRNYSTPPEYLNDTARMLVQGAVFIGTGAYNGAFAESGRELMQVMVNDYLVAYYIHRYGWVSLLVIIAAAGGLFALVLRCSKKQKSFLGRAVTFAAAVIILMQFIAYITLNLTGLPLPQIPLPFFTNGKVTLAFNAFLIGLALSCYRDNYVIESIFAAKNTPKKRKLSA